MQLMRFLLPALLVSICSAKTIKINGVAVELDETVKELECGSAKAITKSYTIPYSIKDKDKPFGLDFGHYSEDRLIAIEMTYENGNVQTTIPVLEELILDYIHIDPKRPYLSTPKYCTSDNEFVFSMWGGGNCSDVCGALSVVKFDENGSIQSIRGVEWNEIKVTVQKK